MRKIISLLLTLIMVLSCFSIVHAKCSVWLRNGVATVYQKQSISGDNIPAVVIGHSSEHHSETEFKIVLDGAKWNYKGKGSIEAGVSYDVIDDTTLKIHVYNSKKAGHFNMYNKDLSIPLYSTPVKGGYITCTIVPISKSLPEKTITYAKYINGKISASTKKIDINTKGTLKPIKISDTTTAVLKKGTLISLDFDTNFKIASRGVLECTGKFNSENCNYYISSKSKSRLIIQLKEDTAEGKGEIVLNDIVIERGSQAQFNAVMVTVASENIIEPFTTTFVVGKYNKDAVYVAPETTKSTTKAEVTTANKEETTEGTTSDNTVTTEAVTEPVTTAGKSIVVKVGADSYMVGNKTYELDAPAYISDGYTMLPLRAMANSFGVSDENIKYDNELKTATLSLGSIKVEITANENVLKVNGLEMPIDCAAQISNNRLFLPLRAISNAFGIDNDNIDFEPESKTITIRR